MNDLILNNAEMTMTMTSREIATLTGKEHRNVLRDIKALEEQGVISPLTFERTYLDAQGKERPCYELPKRETLILTSGYSATQRAAIIDRWLQLETANALPDFNNPAIAARAWAEQYEQKQLAQGEVKRLQVQLDEAKEWVSIKRVATLNGINQKSIKWRELKKASEKVGQKPIKVYDANYGEVNTYHVDAWEVAYPDLELPM